ncbi:DUF3231 family protein [Alkalihalobacillus sp. AL-G]|uniref:DUF3231 family protein n=1 Tax=Alkalihalobacillus sp. AL-G TaxID=2926399 RepID=UPI00272A3ED8|nr:DUF3231 family protein [Alkalihalobacillus sp. AL-G]WLD91694.1 DUF3231 family protein [Alkalihalobacillus sp. AL-G]
MANIFEALVDHMKGTFDDEPKTPLHIGEAMGCWLYYTALAEEIPALEICLNTTTDDELQLIVKEGKDLGESQLNRLAKFMLSEGVSLPEADPHKPATESNAIPLGAKSTDTQIANLLSVKVGTNVVMCATNMSQCVRNDIQLIWMELQSEKMLYGSKLKTMMRKRGWIKVPPYYYPPGMPEEQ